MTKARALPVSLLVATLGGCAPASLPFDANVALRDASAEACDGSLELGLCSIAGTDEPCVGGATEEGVFVPVPDGAGASLVFGPQGSRMLVLAARTRGIEPGDPARPADSGNPVVEVHVSDAEGREVTSYRGRAAFEADPADPTLFVQPEIFVVMDGVAPPEVWITAWLRDRLGAERCGRVQLSMGR